MMAAPQLLDTPRPTSPPREPVKLPLPRREPGKTLRYDDHGLPARIPAGPPKPDGAMLQRRLIAAGRISRPAACTRVVPAAVLAAYDYSTLAEAHDDRVCARLAAIARRTRTTGPQMADHSINGDYGHEPIPTPPPTPPPAPSGQTSSNGTSMGVAPRDA